MTKKNVKPTFSRPPAVKLATAYRCFTHDLRSPVQGGDPIWDGRLPYDLPVVTVDTSQAECGAGWR